MLISAGTMRGLLLLCLLGMLLLSAFYLQRRQMTFMEYLGWGLLAVLLPALGPFLVILSAPGRPKVRYVRYMRRQRQVPSWLRRLREILV